MGYSQPIGGDDSWRQELDDLKKAVADLRHLRLDLSEIKRLLMIRSEADSGTQRFAEDT